MEKIENVLLETGFSQRRVPRPWQILSQPQATTQTDVASLARNRKFSPEKPASSLASSLVDCT